MLSYAVRKLNTVAAYKGWLALRFSYGMIGRGEIGNGFGQHLGRGVPTGPQKCYKPIPFGHIVNISCASAVQLGWHTLRGY